MGVGCSLNHSFTKRTMTVGYMRWNYGRALMVTYQWQAEDSTTGVFFVCDFRIDISVFVRLVWFLSATLSFSLAESSLSSVSHGVLPLSYSVFNCIVNNERTLSAITLCDASLNRLFTLRRRKNCFFWYYSIILYEKLYIIMFYIH